MGSLPQRAWHFLLAIYREIEADRVFMIAAGVTFYGLLAVIPAMTAVVALYSLIADAGGIADMVGSLSGVVPAEVLAMVTTELQRLAAANKGALGITTLVGIAVALWGVQGGIKGLIEALNIAYGTEETRSFLRRTVVALEFALVGSGMIVAIIILAGVVPKIVAMLPGASMVQQALLLLRWPLLVLLLAAGLGLVYFYGPNRQGAAFRWITPGAIVAALLLVCGSAAFAFYLANFAAYSESYGALGSAVALMIWLWLASISVLVGAEVNAELDRRKGAAPRRRPAPSPSPDIALR